MLSQGLLPAETAQTSPEGPLVANWWTDPTTMLQPQPPPAAVWTRDDNQPLLYERTLNWMYGPPGSGKTWAALIAAKQALQAGHHVAYVDWEDHPSTFAERARLLGIHRHLQQPQEDTTAGWLRYADGHQLEEGHMQQIADWTAGDDGEGLVIVDSAGASGAPDDTPKGIPEWIQTVLWPLTLLADDKRPAVLVIDHTAKHRNGTRGPIGAQAKLREVTGIAILTAGEPWTRTTGGHITLICEKDRRGWWRPGQTMATIRGGWDGTTFGTTTLPPAAAGPDNAGMVNVDDIKNTICDIVIASMPDGISYSPLRSATRQEHPISNRLFTSALNVLVDDTTLAKVRVGRYDRYQIPAGTLT